MPSLTNTAISNLEIKERDYFVSDTNIKKLKIKVTPAGNKIFYLVWKKYGKLNKYRIAQFGEIGLPIARKRAEKLLSQISDDRNPLKERAKKIKAEKQDAVAILRTFLDEEYYPWAEYSQKSPDRTRQIMEFNFKSFMKQRMSSISKSDMDRWSRNRLAEGINPKTINRASSAIMAVLNKAVEWEILETNPLGGRKNLKTDKGVVRYLSSDEEARLLKVLEKETGQLPVLITLLLNTGARPKEAFNLTQELSFLR